MSETVHVKALQRAPWNMGELRGEVFKGQYYDLPPHVAAMLVEARVVVPIAQEVDDVVAQFRIDADEPPDPVMPPGVTMETDAYAVPATITGDIVPATETSVSAEQANEIAKAERAEEYERIAKDLKVLGEDTDDDDSPAPDPF